MTQLRSHEILLRAFPTSGASARILHRAALTALVVACIAALTAFRLVDAETGAVTALLVALPILFVTLVVVDFRSAVAIALFELVLMGAGGQWARYGSGMSGRHVLIAAVTAGAALALVREASLPAARRRDLLGRYGLHAVVLAVVFPAVWMTLGLARGNAISDVLGDGNGFVFFAFALVVVALLRRGEGGWLRRCFLAACAANGVVTAALIALATAGAVSLDGTLRTALIAHLDAGGIVGTMPNGAFRLFLGSSLYLQVGLALVTWELLRAPRRVWPWVIYAVLWADVIGTYTRGLWIGAVLAVALVLGLGSAMWRRPATVLAATALMFAAASLVGLAFGRSLPDYVFSRSTTVLSSRDANAASVLQDAGFELGLVGFRASWMPVDSSSRSLVWSVTRPGHSSSRALTLRNDAGNEDDYVAQTVTVRPRTRYLVSAWLDATRVAGPAAGDHSVLVWDPVNGGVFTALMGVGRRGWNHVVMDVGTGPRPSVLQIRLYAPRGTTTWDDVRLTRATRSSRPNVSVIRQTIPPRPASSTRLGAETKTDVAGEVSNSIRTEQFRVLVRHVSERPLFGSGFGSIAKDYPYGTSYSYELSYLDLLFKTGVIGLLLFLSFPLRLVWDALPARCGRRALPVGVTRHETSMVVAIVLSILVVGATNPYLFAAFGLCPLLVAIAWLDAQAEIEQPALARARDRLGGRSTERE